MNFSGSISVPNETDFLFICLTENNYDEVFFERDTFFCRFNNNIVAHSNSREIISYLPKNLEEFLAIWPASNFIKGEYRIYYINMSLLDNEEFKTFLEQIKFGAIFIPENISEDDFQSLIKNISVPVINIKENFGVEEIGVCVERITKSNLENLFNYFPELRNTNDYFLTKTNLKPVAIPSVGFLRSLGTLINRNRGIYTLTHDSQIIVEPSNAETYLEKEKEALMWNTQYLKQALAEKYLLSLSISNCETIDELINRLPKNVNLIDKDDLNIGEFSENFEYLSKYYQDNFDEVRLSSDMIFYLPMINKFLINQINKILKKEKLPKKLLKKIYDSTGYYGTYSGSSNSEKESLYMKLFFSHLHVRIVENRTMDTLLTDYSLGNRIPYLRLGMVPASDINLWYSHMYNNVKRNAELLEVEKFNINKRKIGNVLRSTIGEEMINLIISHGKHIKFVTDAPVEWIEENGVPLGITKSISRLPVVPGNILATHSYTQKVDISYENLKVLIINALNPDDSLYSFGKDLEKIYETQLGEFKEKLFYKEPKNKSEFIECIEEIQPMIFVFYGHGSFDYHDSEGKLHIRNDCITARVLETIEWGSMITILGACETQTFDNNYLNIGNMFIGLGCISVLGTYFPVNGFFTYTFLESLFRHLNNALRDEAPKKIINNWADVIIQARRTQYLLEPIKVIMPYFAKKKILFNFDGVDIGKFIANYCMEKVEKDLSEAYSYRDEAYKAYFSNSPEALKAIEYIFKHSYVFHESLVFTSLGSPEKINILRGV
ncbi:hypothetical protein AB6905_14540 [Carnobacterium maltaromaticum]|uniref:hypothetical protein n=1 Tax=Carnobacterium maltaromaticum TaxID=2751 RepID=UPI0039BDF5DB